MDPSKVNIAAVIAATIVAFVIGGIWYSPILFSNAWLRETGLREEELKKRSMTKVFGVSFVLTFLMALNLGMFLADGKPDWVWGATAGALAGLGWVALAMGVTYMFEARSLKLWLINAGYHVVTFVVMGMILGVWK